MPFVANANAIKGWVPPPIATQLLITTQPSGAVAGVADSMVAKSYAANGTTLAPSWSGSATATITAGTPTARTMALFTASNSESLSHIDNDVFSFAGVDFYAALWIRLTSIPAGGMRVFSKWNGGTSQEEYIISFAATTGALTFLASGNGSTFTTLTGPVLSSGTLYFIEAWHRNGVGIALRVNRGTVASQTHTGGLFAGSQGFSVGANLVGSDQYLDGKMANLFLSDQVTISGAGVGTPDATISADLYNGGIIPYATELDTATIAAAKRSGGDPGDLLFAFDETSGDRDSYSGNFTLTDNNTVTSASSGESITYADVAIESGDTATAVDGVLTFAPVIGRPGTDYQLTVADDASELTSAVSDAFDVTAS